MKISVFWFRRDLRLEDNTGLSAALHASKQVLPLFIFDDYILDELTLTDHRVSFIYDQLKLIQQQLQQHHTSLLVLKGKVEEIWQILLDKYDINKVYVNKDYEPYAINRDFRVELLLAKKSISLLSFKDQVIREASEILKKDGSPYTVFTPYKKKWLEKFSDVDILPKVNFRHFYPKNHPFPKLEELGFSRSKKEVKKFNLSDLQNYGSVRNYPHLDATSYLGPHLRFGTISIRQVISRLDQGTEVFLSELIWREFFMQILFHYPHVVTENFRPKYNGIKWLNNDRDFNLWCKGKTGYPLVDAGMKQLNQTGYMHNRVRMVTASFLCKHLLIDWKWGESYFAAKLLDYELASNNGNWQWVAGTGCDAAPYFRIFNPSEQLKKFDPSLDYVKTWVKEYGTEAYPNPIIEHKLARKRALETYKAGIIS